MCKQYCDPCSSYKPNELMKSPPNALFCARGPSELPVFDINMNGCNCSKCLTDLLFFPYYFLILSSPKNWTIFPKGSHASNTEFSMSRLLNHSKISLFYQYHAH
ncbi:MAG: hypothetical protein DRO88_02725 [Promethearchaeia archaeon]|nr:MAG: hypothetical protein DRO88_02725 [Candidatus Lokiarchaeia archaeon]